ncbi:MAG: potassium channel family protein [Clostridia bacterium]|nr:potassium channel family protein [Clostridia bacterium]
MGKYNLKNNENFYKIVGSIVLCAALFLSVLILGKVENQDNDIKGYSIYLGFATLLLGISEVVSFFRYKQKEGKKVYIRLSYIVLDFAASICAFSYAASPVLFLLACSMYLAIPLFKRTASIARKHTKRNITLNVLIGIINFIFFLVSLGCFAIEGGEEFSAIITGGEMFLICLANVATLSLSNFNLDLLKKIIRKTYAGEILFGLLVLIISFAMALMIAEDSITNIWDGLWYCFAIVTTTGFGDFVAVTTLGRILSVILGIYGIIVVSIITSIIVNFYNEVKSLPDEEDEEEMAEATIAEKISKEEPENALKVEENIEENPSK